MPRKVIIDCDPGIDDAIALCMALFDPRLEVVAVTAVGGNVSPELSTRNVQAIIEQLERVGVAYHVVPRFYHLLSHNVRIENLDSIPLIATSD